MEFAEARGASLACRSDGDASLPAVVFSNSLASNHRMWDAQLSCLLPRFRVIRYDTRGHGGSEAPETAYSMADLGRDCLAVLDHFGVEKAHFVGLSLGGMTGQWLGAEASDRILSLTLCDTASEMPSGVWDERIAQVRDQGMASVVEGTLARWFTPAFAERAPDELQRVREMIAATPLAGFVGCACAIRDMALTPLLARIALPTCVIVGAEDPSTPPSVAEALHRAIAGSELHILPESAHLPNIEQAERFNRVMQDFLHRQIGVAGT